MSRRPLTPRKRPSLADRRSASLRAQDLAEQRRCPDCGRLCGWHNGNVGVRGQCKHCHPHG